MALKQGALHNDEVYRFHLAKKEPSGTHPLEALARSKDEWMKWQVYKGSAKDRFTKDKIVSFAHARGNKFLFVGDFEITSRSQNTYKVEYVENYNDLIGRLIIEYSGLNARATVFVRKRSVAPR